MKYDVRVGICFGKTYTVEADDYDEAREIAEERAGIDPIEAFEFGDMYSEVIFEYRN